MSKSIGLVFAVLAAHSTDGFSCPSSSLDHPNSENHSRWRQEVDYSQQHQKKAAGGSFVPVAAMVAAAESKVSALILVMLHTAEEWGIKASCVSS